MQALDDVENNVPRSGESFQNAGAFQPKTIPHSNATFPTEE